MVGWLFLWKHNDRLWKTWQASVSNRVSEDSWVSEYPLGCFHTLFMALLKHTWFCELLSVSFIVCSFCKCWTFWMVIWATWRFTSWHLLCHKIKAGWLRMHTVCYSYMQGRWEYFKYLKQNVVSLRPVLIIITTIHDIVLWCLAGRPNNIILYMCIIIILDSGEITCLTESHKSGELISPSVFSPLLQLDAYSMVQNI